MTKRDWGGGGVWLGINWNKEGEDGWRGGGGRVEGGGAGGGGRGDWAYKWDGMYAVKGLAYCRHFHAHHVEHNVKGTKLCICLLNFSHFEKAWSEREREREVESERGRKRERERNDNWQMTIFSLYGGHAHAKLVLFFLSHRRPKDYSTLYMYKQKQYKPTLKMCA